MSTSPDTRTPKRGRPSASRGLRLLPAALTLALSATALTSLTASTPASAATQATYYVAPNGDDANAGTS